MDPRVRKTVTYVENVLEDGGKPVERPLLLIGVAAVLKNPWDGRGFVEDLKPEIDQIAPKLGHILTDEVLKRAGSGEAVEAYGKAAVVGTNGEIEHASALIHTLRFGNIYRHAVGAESYLCFSHVRGGPNAAISIPLMHKHDPSKRSHYLTVQFQISDAPAPDELVVALGASVGGKPHHRTGDRHLDAAELSNA